MMNTYVQQYSRMLADASIRYDRTALLQPTVNMNFLIGNGSFGGNLDRFGMMDSLYDAPRCFIWHKKHVEIGRDQLECRLQLVLTRYRFYRDGKELALDAAHVTDYSQTLDLARGMVVTSYTLLDGDESVLTLKLTQYCSLAEAWMMQSEFLVNPLVSDITLRCENEMLDEAISQKNVHITYPVTCNTCREHVLLRSSTTRGSAAMMLLSPDKKAELDTRTLSLTFDCAKEACHVAQMILVTSRDKTTPMVALAELERGSADLHRKAHEAAWEAFWHKSAVDLGDDRLNGIRIRFMYALRCSEGTEEGDVPLSPGGLASSSLWPFEFPQDYQWMYESYFTANHLEMAKSTSQYWNTILDQVYTFTEKFLGVRGAFFPWMPSMFDLSEMERPAEDPPYSWQLHNAAYPLRMIMLYWQYTQDADYLRSVLPVVRGVAEFYANISSFDAEKGKYCITYKPCMGQDEFGGFCRENYLCCMLSAAWSMGAALELFEAAGETPDPAWVDIKAHGYVFDLLKHDGMLATYEGGPTPNPAQKHPSQLNALASLPLPELYESPEFRETYRRRYEISIHADQNFWSGWSYGTFLVASARMRDAGEVRRDVNMMLTNPTAEKPQFDRDFIQMYETGGHGCDQGYFHTAMAMIVIATSELFLQSFDRKCTILPVVLTEERVAFDNLLTPFGIIVSGECEGSIAKITLTVTRETDVEIRLGEDCCGTYKLCDEAGTVLAETDERSFRLPLKAGSYRITV